jgi:hypothetical protein
MTQSFNPLSRPPEGVIRGEDVPLENQKDGLERRTVEEMVGLLKTHPAYSGKSDDELREIAKEKLK